MYKDPVLWNEENQLTGDTIKLSMRNNKLDKVELYKNGFIISEADTGLYNQIKGKHIYGFFKNSKFDKMPKYGTYSKGHIALQDHGDKVWYRNIRIRPLFPIQ